METLHNADQYDVSALIENAKYFPEMFQFLKGEVLAQDDPKKSSKIQRISHIMGVSLVHCKEVEKTCRVSQLNLEPIINKEDDDRNLRDGAQLLVSAAEQLELVEQPQKHHRKMVQLSRWMLQDFTTGSLNQTSQLKLDTGRLDVLVTVRVYKPFRWSQCGAARGNGSPVVAQEIVMHGSQLLCQLWDVITCQNDNVFTGDVTALTQSQMVLIKSITKSAMFFIDETFYSDERDVTSLKNYGAGIAQWLRQQGIDTSRMQHQRMENIRMDQLSIRYGYPYVFRHLDDCEHLVVFTDARFMASNDPQNVTDYPLIQMTPPEIIYCDACKAYPSHWIVDDPEFYPTK